MDPELLKKLEEYGAGFQNVLQDKFLEDDATKIAKGKAIDLRDWDEEMKEMISRGYVIRRIPPETNEFWADLEEMLKRLRAKNAASTSAMRCVVNPNPLETDKVSADLKEKEVKRLRKKNRASTKKGV
ncbi:hypothetical protein Hanom_Chr09g00842241 [Helianthus anomalus]